MLNVNDDRSSSGSFDYVTTVLFALIIGLPTGYLMGYPIKHAALLVSGAYIATIWLRRWQRDGLGGIVFWLGLFLFLFSYMALGLSQWGPLAVREFGMMLTPAVVSLLLVLWIQSTNSLWFFRALFFSVVAILAGVKFLLLAGSLIFDLSFVQINGLYARVFGTGFVSMSLPHGLYRIYVQTDIIAGFAPAIVAWLQSQKVEPRPGKIEYLIIFLSFFVSLFSFSRYIWLLFLICFLAWMLSFRKQAWQVLLATLLLAAAALLSYQLAEKRFEPELNVASDSIRLQQAPALLDTWLDAPFLGNGLGAYNPDLVRSHNEPYSYELQLLSLLPKFGVIGVTIILAGLLAVGYVLVQGKARWAIFIGALTLSAGIFNPYLFNSNIAILYAAIYLAFLTSRNQKAKAIE
ncbi:O-antigen ligase family protein [Thiohalomonas denitrificans]|uniref:O-antigen ligase like membrane protein n=1 Tax=Thiohalomonas denitrificans TaxID=415747 RepID=A0A1G5R0J4_9GAMM|nr:O-antigen ligase family protein [Thiohalomonas denitrificans]SCZ67368.1 O-antigen ligase like membrane protein [Thiohalomonas denitrificans]